MDGAFPYFLAAGLAGAAVMIGRMGIRHVRLSRTQAPHVFEPSTSRAFIGAASTGSFHASWPLAKLEVDREWAHIGGRGLRWVDDVWIRRQDIASVVARPGFGRGITFISDDARYERTFFRASDQVEVIEAFRTLGWSVA